MRTVTQLEGARQVLVDRGADPSDLDTDADHGGRRRRSRHAAAPRRVAGDRGRADRRDPPQRRRPHPALALGLRHPPGGAAALRRRRRAGALPPGGEPAGPLPVHGRRLPDQARRRGPHPHVRRRGRPGRTNRRFHLLAAGQPATRLSTAFDSVTLYGFDPDERPDIYGKVGNSGVSIATLDDMEVLYDGFDLFDPSTSVSMTINGPAPAILAMFLDARPSTQHPELRPAEVRCCQRCAARCRPTSSRRTRARTPASSRPSSRSRMMADIQEWFVGPRGAQLLQRVDLRLPHRRSRREPHQPAGLHAGQRVHLRRGLPGPGHGDRRLRPQPQLLLLQRDGPRVHRARPRGPTHLGHRHARPLRRRRRGPSGSSTTCRRRADRCTPRRWRSTTSAPRCRRSARSTTTPTRCTPTPTTRPSPPRPTSRCAGPWPSSWSSTASGAWPMNDNPLQGSFIIEELTDLVEEAVLAELDRISERGGVLGAMETGYQRGRIQDESMRYEQRKHDGSLPIVGVNTFLDPAGRGRHPAARSSCAAPTTPRSRTSSPACGTSRPATPPSARRRSTRSSRPPSTAATRSRRSMDAVRTARLGEITDAPLRGRGPVPPQRLSRPGHPVPPPSATDLCCC